MTSAGQSTTSFSPSDVAITIEVTNPCKATTIESITFSPTSISVYDGQTATADYVIPGDGVDTANSLSGLCGDKVYTIVDNSDDSAISGWAAITTSTTLGSMTLTIDPSQYGSHISSDISVTLKVTTTFSTWTSNAGSTSTIAVTLQSLTCDCTALLWTAPTITTATINIDASGTPSVPAPVSDTSARSSNLAFDACY